MKYQISCIGKSSNSLENKLIEKFTRRISNKITIKEVIVNILKQMKIKEIRVVLHLAMNKVFLSSL